MYFPCIRNGQMKSTSAKSSAISFSIRNVCGHFRNTFILIRERTHTFRIERSVTKTANKFPIEANDGLRVLICSLFFFFFFLLRDSQCQ